MTKKEIAIHYPNGIKDYNDIYQDDHSIRKEIRIKLYGDESLSKRDIEQKESISSKVGIIIWNMWRNKNLRSKVSN